MLVGILHPRVCSSANSIFTLLHQARMDFLYLLKIFLQLAKDSGSIAPFLSCINAILITKENQDSNEHFH